MTGKASVGGQTYRKLNSESKERAGPISTCAVTGPAAGNGGHTATKEEGVVISAGIRDDSLKRMKTEP
jgi:hypothetical protein